LSYVPIPYDDINNYLCWNPRGVDFLVTLQVPLCHSLQPHRPFPAPLRLLIFSTSPDVKHLTLNIVLLPLLGLPHFSPSVSGF
jgi:hypothetical protein